MKPRNLLLSLSAIILSQSAFAQNAQAARQMMEPGVYYRLSENLAQSLGINYHALLSEARLKEGENLVAKKNEEDGEIDVSIFDHAQFAAARTDLMSGN